MANETPPNTAPDDPRPGFGSALTIAGKVIAEVRPGDLRRPTPCAEFDVEALTRHLISVAQRTVAMGRGRPAESVSLDAADITTGAWTQAWSSAVDEYQRLWTDPALLGREVVLPFGVMPGAVMLNIYTAEVLVHAWDLAVSVGAEPEWDDDLAATALATVTVGVPAEGRGPDMPFDPVVPTPDGAPAIERLVAWMGRNPNRPSTAAV